MSKLRTYLSFTLTRVIVSEVRLDCASPTLLSTATHLQDNHAGVYPTEQTLRCLEAFSTDL